MVRSDVFDKLVTMRKILSLLLISFATLALSQEVTTFVLVRHAEKADDGTKDPPLTAEGTERAERISDLLKNQTVTALYSTPYKRTRETLAFVAKEKSLEIKEYDPFSKDEWLEGLLQEHTGGTILISGHSNTIPILANALLGKDVFSQFDDTDYSNLIIVTTEEIGKGKLVRLTF